MTTVENRKMDEERALYGSSDITVINCQFDGPADGESALKESSNVTVKDSYFNLRYPFWHVHGLKIDNSEMTDKCRAALWYSDNTIIFLLNSFSILIFFIYWRKSLIFF